MVVGVDGLRSGWGGVGWGGLRLFWGGWVETNWGGLSRGGWG